MNKSKVIQKLLNKQCWGVVAGEGTGSIFSLKLGEKVPREKPVNNPHLTEDVKNNEAEFSIMIMSSWELFQKQEAICCCDDSNENDGKMVQGLNKLINQTIKEIQISQHYHELKLVFSEDFILDVFCDGHEIDLDYDNYTIFLAEETFTVQADYSIKSDKL